MSESALKDLKVLEFGEMVSAPYCGKLLADLGAEVIKIEPPEGDSARHYGPFPDHQPHPEKSALFLYNNTGKKSITLDFTKPRDVDTFKKLVKWADALIDNHAPAVLESIGLGWDQLKKENPDLIYTCITPFGRTGPNAEIQGNELIACHAGGLANLLPARSVDISHAPVKLAGFQINYNAGLVAALMTLVLAGNRANTGGGELVDISLQETALSLVNPLVASNRYDGSTWHRVPDRPPGMGRMQTSDGYVVLAAADDHHFRAFRELMGKPDFVASDEWDNRHFRSHHLMDIAAKLEAWMLTQEKHDIHHKAAKVGIPVGPLNTVKDVMENAQYIARDFFVTIDHPEAGKLKYPGFPFKSTAMPLNTPKAAPLLGQHNEEIIKSLSTPRITVSEGVKPEGKQPRRLPLEGTRILDFSWVWAGPYACTLLALLGAEVIKIEGHRRSDLMRRSIVWPLPEPAPRMLKPNEGMGFNAMNLNKKSFTLDLSKPDGVQAALKLVAISDVVIDNMRPNAMVKLGLGYEALQKIKSDIIAITLSSRGYNGPETDYLGFASIHQSVGGLSYITGHTNDHPTHGTAGDADLMNGISTAFLAVAALHYRNQTGKGQFIDYSQCEGVSSLLGEFFLGYQMTGEIAERIGNTHPFYAPHGVFRAWGVDRWLAIAVQRDEEFTALCAVMGQPELAQDPRFKDMAARKKNETALNAIMEAWTRERDRDWMATTLAKAGIAAAPSRNGADLMADPHLKARNAFKTLQHPEIGERRVALPPWKFTELEMKPKYSPLLGEYNHYILEELLGYGKDEIQRLSDNDIILGEDRKGKVLEK
ncbi:MAG: CoA transferase [Proteobacteria bacterium]|nr:CoA transferase [Pseudomonadota bacterium]MBU4470865.1 CoA transferase [Pseudomonadota bacterium]MCG2751863.1 CoA transferase [Desulfobacteraceae bacterium]